jgi:hypothetical protein
LPIHRRAAIASSLVTALVLVLVGGVLRLTGGDGEDRLVTASSPSPTVTATPTHAPSVKPKRTHAPQPTPSPAAIVSSPSPEPIRTHRASATPSPRCTYFPADCPDGEPGWGGGFTGCQQATAWPRSRQPYPDLTIELTLSGNRVESGKALKAWVTVTNEGTETVEYNRSDERTDTVLFDGHGEPASATYFSDSIGVAMVSLAPGEEDKVAVTVRAYSCGDTSRDDSVGLAPGDYSVSAALEWGAHGDDGLWVSDLLPVKVVRRA